MPVNKKQLICLHNLPGADDGDTPKRVYALVTNDTKTVVEANGYFDGVLDNGLGAGDVIMAVLDDDGTPLLKFYFVTAGGADVAIRGIGLPITPLTDNSGGTASNTIAAITDAATKNAIASLAAKINAIQAAITV
ncbi:MAG: hypothetical protein IAE63_06795 [Alphaproteobacteria bacterium]|nr:hypothetical protein [Alphaproteobacteria bacterium]